MLSASQAVVPQATGPSPSVKATKFAALLFIFEVFIVLCYGFSTDYLCTLMTAAPMQGAGVGISVFGRLESQCDQADSTTRPRVVEPHVYRQRQLPSV
jgi:hypothetical protein